MNTFCPAVIQSFHRISQDLGLLRYIFGQAGPGQNGGTLKTSEKLIAATRLSHVYIIKPSNLPSLLNLPSLSNLLQGKGPQSASPTARGTIKNRRCRRSDVPPTISIERTPDMVRDDGYHRAKNFSLLQQRYTIYSYISTQFPKRPINSTNQDESQGNLWEFPILRSCPSPYHKFDM